MVMMEIIKSPIAVHGYCAGSTVVVAQRRN